MSAESQNCGTREQPLIGNGCVTRNNVATVETGVFYAVLSGTVGRGVSCRVGPEAI
jgi:hypothetical protein